MSEIRANTIVPLQGTSEVSIPTLEGRFAKAWINFTDGQTINDSVGVSSISDNGTGNYFVDLSSPLSINSVVVASGVRSSSAVVPTVSWVSSSRIRVRCWDSGGNAMDSTVSLAVYGD